ncbi:MAG: heparinase II/III family protein [Clostridia bacterium]|nr:heparinase II/III family protein [Clostridia bacterium]
MINAWYKQQVRNGVEFSNNFLPKISDREVWDKVDNSIKQIIIARAEEKMGYEWPSIFATDFMAFRRTFDRKAYENKCRPRRSALCDFVLAECFENKGRFYDDIVNLIWLICEESYWGVSAHRYDESLKLPDTTDHYIDLFAAETAAAISPIKYILYDYFKTEYPELLKRIDKELDDRIFTPYLSHTDYWWMAFYHDNIINNWNAWINSSVLTCFLLADKSEKRNQGIQKCCASISNFVNSYPKDGGCNEGPCYWGAAGGSLFLFLYLLQLSTNKKNELFDTQIIKNIGAYIRKVYIGDIYFVNFADGDTKANPSWLSYKFGLCTDDLSLAALGAKFCDRFHEPWVTTNFLKFFFGVLDYTEAKQFSEKAEFNTFEALNDTQVTVLRETTDTNKGLFLAAKGGNNGESHNHNDVGNFIVYLDSHPVIIDTGWLDYTAKTFSNERYTIWVNRSDWHNLPTVNGAVQLDGYTKKAGSFSAEDNGDIYKVNVEFSGVYESGANLNSLERSIEFNKASGVITLTDSYDFKEEANLICEHLMFANKPEINSNTLTVKTASGKSVNIEFSKDFSVTVEEKSQDDSRLNLNWGGKVYRASFTACVCKTSEFKIKITKQ